MSEDRPRRVMWLLNHGAARRFEIPMLRRSGYSEIFLPKSYPDYGFRSASVDWSEDSNLTIPAADLETLNATDWYNDVPRHVWDIANRHFDVMFFLLHFPEFVSDATRSFRGVMIWRTYGREIDDNYNGVLRKITRDRGPTWLKSIGERFVFGMAYEHLHMIEPDYIRKRAVYLPLGMDDAEVRDEWQGSDKRMLFVCPDLETSPYYGRVYRNFMRDFGDLPYAIGGSQPIASTKPNVLGYLPQAEFDRNMRQFRVMYYHSSEPNHVHYHPFEAVKVGMPLVFLANGLLDRLGGKNLPGRATSAGAARRLIARLQAGDKALADRIRATQGVLLNDMQADRCAPFWDIGMKRVSQIVDRIRARPIQPPRPKRIAVLMPLVYRGGSLDATKLVAEAIHHGSRQAGEPAQVVIGYPEDATYNEEDFAGLPDGVQKRPFKWREVTGAQARRIMALAGDDDWTAESSVYQVPDDGINTFYDCDVWLQVSDRAMAPLLPIRSVAVLVYDYVQRYFELWDLNTTYRFLRVGWLADKVLTTTKFTTRDAIQFGSVPLKRVARLPMLGRRLIDTTSPDRQAAPYFVWPTNASPHKNHGNAAKALSIYYNEMQGRLECVITGTDSEMLAEGGRPHLDAAAPILQRLAKAGRVIVARSLEEQTYARLVEGAVFVWHPATVDNGTFSVVEAAFLGVPSLSSDYPPMREMDETFGLGLHWAPADEPYKMAAALRWMEDNSNSAAKGLPSAAELEKHSPEELGLAYWKEVGKLA